MKKVGPLVNGIAYTGSDDMMTAPIEVQVALMQLIFALHRRLWYGDITTA